MVQDEVSARQFSIRSNGSGGGSSGDGDDGDDDGGNARLASKAVAVHDFASFMMLFNDIFMKDEFYTDFGMTDDVMTSNIIGSGAQFDVKLVRLTSQMSLRTSSDASSRLIEGHSIVLKRPRLAMDPLTHRFTESWTIASIVNEFRVISHPALRQHPNILDVYGFAWENEEHLPGIAVCPIIMVEFGYFGTLDQYLSVRRESLDLDAKLRLASGIAHGVEVLHKCRIVHSDLKPENIMVVRAPDGKAVAKLSDFGLSLILDERQSPSKWTEGSPGWMAPEWQTSCTNEQLFSADVYSCGLLLWSILLNGKNPWSLDVFGTQDSQLSFEAAKSAEGGIVDIALATALESPVIPEERADEIGTLLRSLLASRTERSLGLMLEYQDDLQLPNPTSLLLKPVAGRVMDDRPIFPEYHELRNLNLAVKNQILESVSKIALNENEGLQRRANACYTVAILYLQRIGTVRSKESQASEYVGYEIDCDKVMSWLRRAAELASPSAQAMYYPLSQGLGAYLETNEKHAERPWLHSVCPQQVILWLRNATALGSDIASQHLRDLDHSSWEQGQSLLRSKYCGVGRILFAEDITQHRDISLSFLGNISASDMVGSAGDTMLHLAAMMGRQDVLIRLCHGAFYHDVNKQNSRGETPLLQATRSGHFKIAKHLLIIGANAGLTTSNDENALHWLSSFIEETEKEISELALMMIQSGAVLEQVCSESTIFNPYFSYTIGPGTPLCRAVQRNAYTAAKSLVQLGADPYNGDGNFPMALACSSHNTRFIGLFLESRSRIRLPAWQDRPGLWDSEHNWEVLKAKWRKEKTFQTAAPNAWKSTKERGTECSLLGYVVSPHSIDLRMALHGAQYLQQMQLAIQTIASLGSQSFRRVTWNYESALVHSIHSRDASIVSYLHEAFPEDMRKSLTNPVPTSAGACLPIQLALLLGDKPIFDILLRHSGPNTVVDITDMEGMTDNWFSQTALWLFTRRSTIARHKVSSSFVNLIHLAAAAHPDPHFMEAILSPLPQDEAKKLVNSHGNADELPLTMAACRHFFAVADVLLKYGADMEEEGNKPPDGQGLPRSCLGVALNFNNHGTPQAVSWMLKRKPSFIVNKRHDITALSMAIRAGGVFEISEKSPLLPVRLYREDTRLLEKILDHFSDPELVNHQWKDENGLYGMTALHWAILRMQPESVELLLAAGANPELTMRLPDGSGTVTAREMALGFDEDTIPEEVKERGEGAILQHLKRFEDVKRLFTEEASH